MKTCCFTGHRVIPDCDIDNVKKKLLHTVEKLVDEGYLMFISGGARGFDLLSAMVVLAIKKKNSKVKLKLILPCADQDSKWSDADKMLYKYVLSSADEVVTLNETYVTGCMHQRNRKMVDEADLCIAYLTRSFGGTKATVDYAKSKDIKVVQIL